MRTALGSVASPCAHREVSNLQAVGVLRAADSDVRLAVRKAAFEVDDEQIERLHHVRARTAGTGVRRLEVSGSPVFGDVPWVASHNEMAARS